MSSVVSAPGITAASQRSAVVSSAFHIPSLDGVRALAFLIVFVSHAGLKDFVPGGFGVTVFFLLSGYLITTLLRMEFVRYGSINLRAFYMRRTLRILPLLYITLSVAILLRLAGSIAGQITTNGVLSQVFHWSNYYLIAHGPESVVAGTIVLWSLAIEEHFYLLFPVIFRWMSRSFQRRTQGWLLVSACAACLAWRLILILAMHQPVVRTELGTDTRFDGLLFGCLMAIVANPAFDDSPWLTLKRIRIAALLAIPVLLFTFLYRNETFRYTWRFGLQSIALLPLFAYVIKERGSFIFRALNTRWVVELGLLSYSLYLVHAVILDGITEHVHASHFTLGAISLSIAIVVSKLLQIGVERPIAKLRKNYAHDRT